jgi:hypothetical protein
MVRTRTFRAVEYLRRGRSAKIRRMGIDKFLDFLVAFRRLKVFARNSRNDFPGSVW